MTGKHTAYLPGNFYTMDRTAEEVQSLIDMLDTAINEIRLDQMQDKNSKLIARNPEVSRKPVKIQNRLGNQRAGTASIKEEDIATLHRVTVRLDRNVTTPRLRSAIFRAIRNRFLSTFRRNQLQMHTAGVQQPINGGNPIVAHEGNCAADAYLYKIGQRKDAATFIELYGIPPQVVSSLSESSKCPCKQILLC